MISIVNTGVCRGIEGRLVKAETDLANGIPSMNIVGLASATVQESKERIKAAIINSGYEFPRGRITVNLAPAELKKNGSCLDLPIAVGVLATELCVNANRLVDYGIIGELSLEGKVLETKAAMPIVMAMKDAGIRKIIVPRGNFDEAAIIDGLEIFTVENLKECVDIVNSGIEGTPSSYDLSVDISYKGLEDEWLDFRDIGGQENAKRAISVAVAGRHGMLMVGPPGCGKTMLAKRIPGIMPGMSKREMLETEMIYSVAGRDYRIKRRLPVRPFRNPNSTIGRAGLIGGGLYPVPGELTLAHNGVLFLDEICEFDRECIEALRQPLEEKKIVHFRMGEPFCFPADSQIIMSSNPCPCGFYGDNTVRCKCSQSQIDNYRRKLSGPIMDRIDIRIAMEKVNYDEISGSASSNISTSDLYCDVKRGREFAISQGRAVYNSEIKDSELKEICALGKREHQLMEDAYTRLKLTPRSYNKVLKVARTIADMDESVRIMSEHLAEALSYRMLTEVNSGV